MEDSRIEKMDERYLNGKHLKRTDLKGKEQDGKYLKARSMNDKDLTRMEDT